MMLYCILFYFFQELEQGERKIETTSYVDRDRAAAVNMGASDIKSDLKGKRR